jgi:hypothetical protein
MVFDYQRCRDADDFQAADQFQVISDSPIPSTDADGDGDEAMADINQEEFYLLCVRLHPCSSNLSYLLTHRVQHSIDTQGTRPIPSPPHRVFAAENDLISSMTDDMLRQGIITNSHSPWS